MILRGGFPLKLKATRGTLDVRLSTSRGLRELSVHENTNRKLKKASYGHEILPSMIFSCEKGATLSVNFRCTTTSAVRPRDILI